jgi:hypothetical protein
VQISVAVPSSTGHRKLETTMSTAFTNTGGWPIFQSQVVLAWYTSPGAAAQRAGAAMATTGAPAALAHGAPGDDPSAGLDGSSAGSDRATAARRGVDIVA